MKCPHCLEGFHDVWAQQKLGSSTDGQWTAEWTECPECRRAIIRLTRMTFGDGGGISSLTPNWDHVIVYPKAPSRAPLDKRVPDDLAEDYRQACLVLPDSPKASAALSRRCLQHLLRETAGIKKRNLDQEIGEAINQLPAHLGDAIDGVRVIGNFAAHPIKSESTGEVVDVEPGEAEWNLDTLEGLFAHYFVQPALLAEKRDKLNAKLADAGKPQLRKVPKRTGAPGGEAAT